MTWNPGEAQNGKPIPIQLPLHEELLLLALSEPKGTSIAVDALGRKVGASFRPVITVGGGMGT